MLCRRLVLVLTVAAMRSEFHISILIGLDSSVIQSLLTAIHKDYFELVSYRELLFNDFGDRVAQLLHVRSLVPFPLNEKQIVQQEVLIVNTHLLFPHDSSLSIARLHQVYKILEYLEAYQKEKKLSHIPIILCGDWNGSKRGHVYKFLRSQGFISSYDVAQQLKKNQEPLEMLV
ncbi:unnamed protein product [Eruca vesicaria subsp. sativa]|uniref:Endonuclease/exonuclease/phosphatase domain-containing protein n=1 Tax=Eruca vesicaria subsp. sativa TaxID=29727 RepID=A0ABC8LFU4_ERUVS|nr:unnamed protein product [Eruca vesicaria subsp. sativa]